jgi:hypothetical protein
LICNNFLEILEQVSQKYLHSIISFTHLNEITVNERYHPQRTFTAGCAIMIPAKYIKEMLWFIDNRVEVYAKP